MNVITWCDCRTGIFSPSMYTIASNETDEKQLKNCFFKLSIAFYKFWSSRDFGAEQKYYAICHNFNRVVLDIKHSFLCEIIIPLFCAALHFSWEHGIIERIEHVTIRYFSHKTSSNNNQICNLHIMTYNNVSRIIKYLL